MKYNEWIEGFTIFAKYPAAEQVLSRYDQVWVCVDPETVSKDDLIRLKELSWYRADDDDENAKYFYRWCDSNKKPGASA